MVAIKHDYDEMLELLLKRGNNCWPVHFDEALYKNRNEQVKLLLLLRPNV